jgi:hypothetical protein
MQMAADHLGAHDGPLRNNQAHFKEKSSFGQSFSVAFSALSFSIAIPVIATRHTGNSWAPPPRRLGRATMRQYYFTIRSCNHEYQHERGVVLKDDAAALDYACLMARELRQDGYTDHGLVVSVRNEMREIVLSVPFLAACA